MAVHGNQTHNLLRNDATLGGSAEGSSGSKSIAGENRILVGRLEGPIRGLPTRPFPIVGGVGTGRRSGEGQGEGAGEGDAPLDPRGGGGGGG